MQVESRGGNSPQASAKLGSSERLLWPDRYFVPSVMLGYCRLLVRIRPKPAMSAAIAAISGIGILVLILGRMDRSQVENLLLGREVNMAVSKPDNAEYNQNGADDAKRFHDAGPYGGSEAMLAFQP